MKNNHKAYFLAIIFLFIFTACTNNSLIAETPLGFSDDNLSAGSSSVAVMQALGGLTENDKKPEKEALHFLETSESARGRLDYFLDDDGTEYVFQSETGKYLGFLKIMDKRTIGPEILEHEAQIIADATAAMFVDISKYSYRECEPRGGYPDGTIFQIDSYDFSYSKTLSGYKTTEGIAVWTTSGGTVFFVHMGDIGKFDGLVEPKIDEKEMDAKFLNEVKKQHGDDAVVAQIYSRILDYEDSQFVMRYDFSLDVQYGHARQNLMVPV